MERNWKDNFSEKDLSETVLLFPHIPKAIHDYLRHAPANFQQNSIVDYGVDVGALVIAGDVIGAYGRYSITAPCDGVIEYLGSSVAGTYDWEISEWTLEKPEVFDDHICRPNDVREDEYFMLGIRAIRGVSDSKFPRVGQMFNFGELWLVPQKKRLFGYTKGEYAFESVIDVAVMQSKEEGAMPVSGHPDMFTVSQRNDSDLFSSIGKYWPAIRGVMPLVEVRSSG